MSTELTASVVAQQPTGRIRTPADTANLVRFLLSEQGHWLTGQLIHINGGFPRWWTMNAASTGTVAARTPKIQIGDRFQQRVAASPALRRSQRKCGESRQRAMGRVTSSSDAPRPIQNRSIRRDEGRPGSSAA